MIWCEKNIEELTGAAATFPGVKGEVEGVLKTCHLVHKMMGTLKCGEHGSMQRFRKNISHDLPRKPMNLMRKKKQGAEDKMGIQ